MRHNHDKKKLKYLLLNNMLVDEQYDLLLDWLNFISNVCISAVYNTGMQYGSCAEIREAPTTSANQWVMSLCDNLVGQTGVSRLEE